MTKAEAEPRLSDDQFSAPSTSDRLDRLTQIEFLFLLKHMISIELEETILEILY